MYLFFVGPLFAIPTLFVGKAFAAFVNRDVFTYAEAVAAAHGNNTFKFVFNDGCLWFQICFLHVFHTFRGFNLFFRHHLFHDNGFAVDDVESCWQSLRGCRVEAYARDGVDAFLFVGRYDGVVDASGSTFEAE